jgi:V-type H+-transporting ATPase subunit a
MFGDVAHGGVLLAAGVGMCLLAERIKSSGSGLTAFLPVRYILLMMGFFATYMGFIYNDCLSFSLSLFG